MNIYCYNLTDFEKPFYTNESKKYGFKIQYLDLCLDKVSVKRIPKDIEGILICPSCKINEEVLSYLKTKTNVKYISTSSAGFDHIDIESANKYGFKIGRIPAYSPTSVASWAFTTGLELVRKTGEMFYNATKYDFKLNHFQPIKEFKNLTVGIIGTGKIGYESAKYFHSVGFKVLGYDVYPSDKAKEILTYVDLNTLLKESDLVVLHIPYFKGENDKFIDKEFIKKMKKGAYLVNASRGQLVDYWAVIDALKKEKLNGFGTDVFLNEENILGNKLTKTRLSNLNFELLELLKFYPKVLVSQHLAYFTDIAITNMAETSMLNFKQLKETNTCDTTIN